MEPLWLFAGRHCVGYFKSSVEVIRSMGGVIDGARLAEGGKASAVFGRRNKYSSLTGSFSLTSNSIVCGFGCHFPQLFLNVLDIMVNKSKLKTALDDYKAVDYQAEHQKRLRKQAEKSKKLRLQKDELSNGEEPLAPNGLDRNAAVSYFHGLCSYLAIQQAKKRLLPIILVDQS